MSRFVVLLRGINVGGKNPIGMPALKALLEGQGFTDVVTYIQSGNVVLTSGRSAGLAGRIEAILSKAFGYCASVVLLTPRELSRVVTEAPAGFGTRPELFRYDVIFLKAPLTAAEALARAPTRPGVDRVSAGPGVLYFSRLVRNASLSRMSRIVALPIYKQMTIRNWNTTTRLLALAEGVRANAPGGASARRDPAPPAGRPPRRPRRSRRAGGTA